MIFLLNFYWQGNKHDFKKDHTKVYSTHLFHEEKYSVSHEEHYKLSHKCTVSKQVYSHPVVVIMTSIAPSIAPRPPMMETSQFSWKRSHWCLTGPWGTSHSHPLYRLQIRTGKPQEPRQCRSVPFNVLTNVYLSHTESNFFFVIIDRWIVR